MNNSINTNSSIGHQNLIDLSIMALNSADVKLQQSLPEVPVLQTVKSDILAKTQECQSSIISSPDPKTRYNKLMALVDCLKSNAEGLRATAQKINNMEKTIQSTIPAQTSQLPQTPISLSSTPLNNPPQLSQVTSSSVDLPPKPVEAAPKQNLATLPSMFGKSKLSLNVKAAAWKPPGSK